MNYPFKEIEPKWQRLWEEAEIFKTRIDRSRPKYYVLDMFPYPSGSGLHVGHVEGYTATDIVARYKRACGFNVLHPMGWDAFGLPAEQYAIETGVHPERRTKECIAVFKQQLKSLGFSYDWSREFSTCDPSYYKWTQFIFSLLYKRGLAYEKEMPVNWCPALRTVLANEEVVDGKSERGGYAVEKRLMKQWMLKITAYTERLLADIDTLDWHERTKLGQRNWIGKSFGLQGGFKVKDSSLQLEIFTTRPDTLWGVTFMVLAPEHPLALTVSTRERHDAVKQYIRQALSRSAVDRQIGAEKTGVFTGAWAVNPVTGQEVPIWVADYVLMDYGTGAIMAVPGHDRRDFEFARKQGLPVVRVLQGGDLPAGNLPFEGDGVLVNSGFISGLGKEEAIGKVIDFFEKNGLGVRQVNYKFRDWLFSRQRYWGEPFPVLHDEVGGVFLVDDQDLPVTLPALSDFEPSETGEPPLSKAPQSWLEVNGKRREVNTMPGYAGSAWYFLRFCDPHNDGALVSKEAESYFMPVDLYVGGAEHTVGHLMYARFWQKVLYDAGLVSFAEPFKRLVHPGVILGEDGERMSKSRGNVVNPDDIVEAYGADSLRVYEMFLGPLERDKPWSTHGVVGVSKFLNKVWRLMHAAEGDGVCMDDGAMSLETEQLVHQTIKKVGDDIETLNFNTAISQLMILVNELTRLGCRNRQVLTTLVQLLSPFAPHIAEEMWERLGEKGFVAQAPWPKYEAAKIRLKDVTIAVQVNGKTRGTVALPVDSAQAAVLAIARDISFVQHRLQEGQKIDKVIFVKNKIINLVMR